MSVKIIFLGDMHVGRNKDKEEENNFNVIVKKILRDHTDASVISFAGDIVNDGRKSQYKAATLLLEPLMENYLVWGVPGNHDYGWKGNHAQRKRFKYFKHMFSPLNNISYPDIQHDKEGNIHICLNTMKEETNGLDGLLADGELGERQIEDLDGILGKLESRPSTQKVLISLHHHPFLFPDEGAIHRAGEKIGHWLKDGDDLTGVISNRGVDALMFGHEHRHLNFSKTNISKQYGIPCILSAGKCTDFATEYKLDADGNAITEDQNGNPTTDYLHHNQLLGYEIIIDGPDLTARSITFG